MTRDLRQENEDNRETTVVSRGDPPLVSVYRILRIHVLRRGNLKQLCGSLVANL